MAAHQQLQVSELSQEERTQVLRRAQALEVERHAPPGERGDLETFLRSAEEAGLSREALLQAVREQVGHPLDGIQAGDRVFAKSANGAFYAATVTGVRDGAATVRFLGGGDLALPLQDLRAFALLPGKKVTVKWPMYGWWQVELERYDPATETVTVTDGYSSKTFPLTEVRLPLERTPRQRAVSALLFRAALISAGVGGILGALLMRLFS